MEGFEMSFALHPDLVRDGIEIGRLSLCQILLINDATYPWFVLVPERNHVSDTIDLAATDHATLWDESRIFSQGIMGAFAGEKLNVAALGNVTPQLHVHHIIRYKSDPAWPDPIWGKCPMRPYTKSELEGVRDKLKSANISVADWQLW